MFKFSIVIIYFWWWWWWWWSWWSSYHWYAKRWYNLVIPWFCSDSHDLFFFSVPVGIWKDTHTHTLVRCDDLVWAQGFCALRMAMFFCRCLLQNFGGLSSSLKKKVHTQTHPARKREQWNMWSVSHWETFQFPSEVQTVCRIWGWFWSTHHFLRTFALGKWYHWNVHQLCSHALPALLHFAHHLDRHVSSATWTAKPGPFTKIFCAATLGACGWHSGGEVEFVAGGVIWC